MVGGVGSILQDLDAHVGYHTLAPLLFFSWLQGVNGIASRVKVNAEAFTAVTTAMEALMATDAPACGQ